MNAAEDVLALAMSRPPTLGPGRLICIDGPSGAGKTRLSRAIARKATATVVHTDDACPGWDGLPRIGTPLLGLLTALAENRPGSYPRYDWITGAPADDVLVEPCELLVLEGVGAGHRAWAGLTTALVWMDADPVLRQQRALARDGDYFRAYWDDWAAAESVLFEAEQPSRRADLRFD